MRDCAVSGHGMIDIGHDMVDDSAEQSVAELLEELSAAEAAVAAYLSGVSLDIYVRLPLSHFLSAIPLCTCRLVPACHVSRMPD